MEIVPSFGSSAAALAAEEVLKNVIEDVAEPAALAESLEALALLRPGMAEHVVPFALVLIAERFVGLVDLFEFDFGFFLLRVAGVQVRMVLACEFAVRLLQLFVGRVLFNAENIVVIAF